MIAMPIDIPMIEPKNPSATQVPSLSSQSGPSRASWYMTPPTKRPVAPPAITV